MYIRNLESEEQQAAPYIKFDNEKKIKFCTN